MTPSPSVAAVLACIVAAGQPRANAADPPLISFTTDQNNYTVQFSIFISPSNFAAGQRFQLDHADIFFPLIESTASSTGDLNSVAALFWWRKKVWSDQFRILPAVPGFGRFGAMEFRADTRTYRGAGLPDLDRSVTDEVRIDYSFAQISRETKFDEKRARDIPWPATFPPALDAWLQPEPLVQSLHPAIVELVDEWTQGSPRTLSPVMLAKDLCGRVVQHVQPSAPNYRFNSRGRIAGLDVQGAAFAAVEKSGSCFDMAAMLVAVYRAAGLPARVVIGLDVAETNKVRDPVFQAWAEFALFDPNDNTIEWIPVDVVRQRAFSSRPPPATQPWEYFGNNRFLDTAFPLSFHFHPPDRAVGSGGIIVYDAHALWGWVPSPLIPTLEQRFSISVIGTPQRGGRP